jgi:Tar ligand binding domain homologue
MIRSSIRTKILAIAVGMIVLMVITAVLSLTLVTQVGHRLEQMTNSYIPAYGNLARGNIRSLERALALRRMVIAKSQSPPDQATFATAHDVFDEKGAEVVREVQSARAMAEMLRVSPMALPAPTPCVTNSTRRSMAFDPTCLRSFDPMPRRRCSGSTT